MKDIVLAMIGTVGIAALALSMNNDKEVREDFSIAGFGFRPKLQKVDEKGNAIPVPQYPSVLKCTNKNKVVENYETNGRVVGNGLGSSKSTNMPFITPTPRLNQSVNRPSPSMNLPATIRYNTPSLSNMGITEDFQCNSVRENYSAKSGCLSPTSMNTKDFVGPDYRAGKLPPPEKKNRCNLPKR